VIIRGPIGAACNKAGGTRNRWAFAHERFNRRQGFVTMTGPQVGFIGGGQMAAALLSGAFQSGKLKQDDVLIVETDSTRREQLAERFPGAAVSQSAADAADCSKVILAVKPQILRAIGGDLASQTWAGCLWVSIAAGVSLQELSLLLKSQRIIRVMPNTPAQVGSGAAALAASSGAQPEDISWTQAFMESVGICVTVDESHMHAVTGIAGSSPAYIYLIIEALSDAGVAGGLPRNLALQLSAQAVLGAAKMVLETGKHPGELKDQVTSPAGTTIAAIRELEAAGVRSGMIEAVAACIARSRELEAADE
jgi:pyrroline-5-carboxylate reductase